MSSESQSARNLNVPNVLMNVPNVLKVPKCSNLNVPNIPNVLKVPISPKFECAQCAHESAQCAHECAQCAQSPKVLKSEYAQYPQCPQSPNLAEI